MRKILSRRDFIKLFFAGLGSSILASCKGLYATPTPVPTAATPESTALPPTNTSAPPVRDIPRYKNSFEEVIDLAADGITSTQNELRINTENVAFQSGSQCLEARGMIGEAAYSLLTIDLSV